MECPIGVRERSQAGLLGVAQVHLCPSAVMNNKHASLAAVHTCPRPKEAECKLLKPQLKPGAARDKLGHPRRPPNPTPFLL